MLQFAAIKNKNTVGLKLTMRKVIKIKIKRYMSLLSAFFKIPTSLRMRVLLKGKKKKQETKKNS